MATTADLTQITPPRVPLIDNRTGLISREWYRFFLNMFSKTSGSTESLLDLQLVPRPQDPSATVQDLLQSSELASQQNTSEQLAQLFSSVQALESNVNAAHSGLDRLFTDIQSLAVAPSNSPHLASRAYGSFYDTTTQTPAAINTAYAVTFNSTAMSNGVTIGSPTSRIYVDRQGVYNIQFSAQLDNTSGGNHLIFIWLSVNGADVANSASQVRLKGTDGELVAAWNFLYDFKANDYFELMWSVDNTSVQIAAQAAAAPVPAIPSIILTVTDNISAYYN